MADAYRAVPITERVYWVGAVDWTLRDFHGYTTRRGSSYNAYLILADRVTLVDTVKKPFKEELLSRVASVIDPRKVEVVVSNHSEMDHSGCLAEVIEEVRPREVYASPMGVKTLAALSPSLSTGITAVADGRSVSLGNMTLSFMETRMLHWPDSMFTYLQEEKLLFSHDAFGMHLASHERFADEIDAAVLEYEAATYFANILLPYAGLMTKLLARVDSAGMSFDVIAPDHGPVWRRNPEWIVEHYRRWAQQKRAKKAVVVYGTMWHSTEKMPVTSAKDFHPGRPGKGHGRRRIPPQRYRIRDARRGSPRRRHIHPEQQHAPQGSRRPHLLEGSAAAERRRRRLRFLRVERRGRLPGKRGTQRDEGGVAVGTPAGQARPDFFGPCRLPGTWGEVGRYTERLRRSER